MYFREYPDRLAVGGYGHVPLPVDAADLLHPRDAPVMPSVLEFTPDTFAETWSWAEALVPALRPPEARIERGINGDLLVHAGRLPADGRVAATSRGFWLAEAVWVTHALGVGRAMAEWLVDGGSTTDLHECDLNRFETHQLAPDVHPRPRHPELRRGLRHRPPAPADGGTRGRCGRRRSTSGSRSSARSSSRAAAGSGRTGTGSTSALLARYGGEIPARNAWAARYWHPIVGAEARATRDGVAMYDVTPLKRIAVEGPGALAFLDGLTTNRLDRPVGTVVYSLHARSSAAASAAT